MAEYLLECRRNSLGTGCRRCGRYQGAEVLFLRRYRQYSFSNANYQSGNAQFLKYLLFLFIQVFVIFFTLYLITLRSAGKGAYIFQHESSAT